jgi:hypothetical protein
LRYEHQYSELAGVSQGKGIEEKLTEICKKNDIVFMAIFRFLRQREAEEEE